MGSEMCIRDRSKTPLKGDERGIWEVFLPDRSKRQSPAEGSRIKVHIIKDGRGMDRIPAYIRQVEKEGETDYYGVVLTEIPYKWRNKAPALTWHAIALAKAAYPSSRSIISQMRLM